MIMADLDQRGPDVPLTLGVGPGADCVRPRAALRLRHHLGLRLLEVGAQGPHVLRDPPADQARVTRGLGSLQLSS